MSRGPELWLIFPDIRNGDCMLVQDPSTDRVVLIDSGTDEDSSQQILASMNRAGVAHLDGIILASDRDRSLGGLPSLLSQTRVIGPVLLPGDAGTLATHGDLTARLAMSAIDAHGLRSWSLDHAHGHMPDLFGPGSRVQISLIPVPRAAGDTNPNDPPTLAVRIDYGQTVVLDTAALTPSEEDSLLASQRSALACDVLAVADGGSTHAASSEFLAMSAPRVAAITCTAGQPPADETLERLQAAGADVGRTDLLHSFTLRLSRYPEEPILWSTSASASPAPQTRE